MAVARDLYGVRIGSDRHGRIKFEPRFRPSGSVSYSTLVNGTTGEEEMARKSRVANSDLNG